VHRNLWQARRWQDRARVLGRARFRSEHHGRRHHGAPRRDHVALRTCPPSPFARYPHRSSAPRIGPFVRLLANLDRGVFLSAHPTHGRGEPHGSGGFPLKVRAVRCPSRPIRDVPGCAGRPSAGACVSVPAREAIFAQFHFPNSSVLPVLPAVWSFIVVVIVIFILFLINIITGRVTSTTPECHATRAVSAYPPFRSAAFDTSRLCIDVSISLSLFVSFLLSSSITSRFTYAQVTHTLTLSLSHLFSSHFSFQSYPCAMFLLAYLSLYYSPCCVCPELKSRVWYQVYRKQCEI